MTIKGVGVSTYTSARMDRLCHWYIPLGHSVMCARHFLDNEGDAFPKIGGLADLAQRGQPLNLR